MSSNTLQYISRNSNKTLINNSNHQQSSRLSNYYAQQEQDNVLHFIESIKENRKAMDVFVTTLQQTNPNYLINKNNYNSLRNNNNNNNNNNNSNKINLNNTMQQTTTRNLTMNINSSTNKNNNASFINNNNSQSSIYTNTLGQRKNTISPTSITKRLQPKEYFQKYIREENKKYIQKQRKLTIESSSYIEYDRRNKNDFRQKVAQYMEQLDREEKDLEMHKVAQGHDKIIDDVNTMNIKPQIITIEQWDVTKKDIADTDTLIATASGGTALPPLLNQRNNAIFMIQQKLSQTINELNPSEQKQLASLSKKKELPRYMQPNQAWLTKDKTTTQQQINDLIKDTSTTHNGKSKGSLLFPTISKLDKKKRSNGDNNGDELLDSEAQLTMKQAKLANKYFVINREDPLIIDLFKKICQEKRDSNIIRARLTKGKMKAHLSRKYKGKVAEKILSYLDFSVPLDFNGYIDLLEKLLNFGQDKLKRIAFTVFDFNDDRSICQLDLYSIMKMYESDDQVFVNAYSYDICKLIAFLDTKKIQKGNQNYELNQKLRNIQRKVELAMRQYQSQKHNSKHKNRIIRAAVEGGDDTSKLGGSIGNMSYRSSIQDNTTDSAEDDQYEEEEDEYEQSSVEDDGAKTTTNKTLVPATKSQYGGFMSRRNSVMSKRPGKSVANQSEIRKDFKRMNTNMSRMSRVSRGSGKSVFSGKSRVSSRRYQGGFFSHYTAEQNDEEEKENPFDVIFGKNIYKRMKGNKDYNEKMTFAEYKQSIQWGDNLLPQFIVDLIQYISCFLIDDYIKQKKQQEKEEQEQKLLHEMIEKRRQAGEQFDENFLIEQYKRQKMNDMDAELLITKNKIGETQYRKLLRFFKSICKNPVESKDSGLFMTQESLTKKLKNHFGHKCDFIAQRLYYNFSNNVNLKRIYFKEFIDKIMILWEGSQRDLFRLAFQIVDIDHDGLLNGPDLLTVQDQIDINSIYGQEILLLVDHYVTTHLMTKSRINPKHFLHLDNYIMLLGGNNSKSCIIEELKLKILSKPGRHAQKSVFFKDSSITNNSDINSLANQRRLNKYGMTQVNNIEPPRQQQQKRAILMWSGGNLLKDKKFVTFSYIPPHKDEDDENYQQRRQMKKKIAKDLPTTASVNIDDEEVKKEEADETNTTANAIASGSNINNNNNNSDSNNT